MLFFVIGAVILAYLIGSINFAVIFTKAFMKKDVRDFGSGNAGSTNALRVGGKLNGILTFIFDFLKGTLASFIGLKIFEMLSDKSDLTFLQPIYGAYICGIACMIGHILPFFFEFKGGKGVATGAGIFIAICPAATLIGLSVFAIVAVLTKYVSVASLVATVSVVLSALLLDKSGGSLLYKVIMGIIIALMIFFRHRENIVRLINHEENKINSKGK